MAIKDIGGVLADTTVTGHLSEEAATPIAARLREAGASVEALADATEATLTGLGRTWTISHIARVEGGRLAFAPGTGTIPVRRTSTGRLAVSA